MSVLRNRVRRLLISAPVDADAFMASLTDSELHFLVHHVMRELLKDPKLPISDRTQLEAETLPPAPYLTEEHATALPARAALTMEDRSSRRMSAHANTGDPNGPVEACPLLRSRAR
jgi:hypothetical protein